MKRLLVLNFFPAFYPPASGGELRYYYFYLNLSRYFDVTLLSPTYQHCPPEICNHTPTFREYRVPKEQTHLDLHVQLGREGIGAECSALVCALAYEKEKGYRRAYRDLVRKADIVVHESPYMLRYDSEFGLDGRPRIYASYNVEALLAASMFQGPRRSQYISLVRDYERSLVLNSALVCATSEEEKEGFISLYGCAPDKLVVVPNGFELALDKKEKEPVYELEHFRDAPFAVFMGSAHPPNTEAVGLLCTLVAPRLPELTFIVAGSVCLTRQDWPPNVVPLGRVSDSARDWLLENCTAALNPMVSGAGTNLKMLDFLAAGAPIVSTPFGARGLKLRDGEHCLISSPETFAESLKTLLANAELRKTLALEGRSFVRTNYTWHHIAERAQERFARCQGAPTARVVPRAKRLLILNDFSVANPRGGGEFRMVNIYRRLARHFQVTLLCFSDSDVVERTRISSGFEQIAVPKTSEHREMEARINRLFVASANDIIASICCLDNRELVSQFRTLHQMADVVVCVHPYLAPLLERAVSPKPLVYEAFNVEHTFKQQLLSSHPHRDRLIETTRIIEEFVARTADKIITVSAEDARGFARYTNKKKITVVRNGVDIQEDRFDPPSVQLTIQNPSAVFIGSAHPPNIEAVGFLIEHVIPRLPAAVTFYIAGSVCEAICNRPLPTNLVLLGFLDDGAKRVLLEKVDVGLNPVLSGGGSNLKLADYFAAGVPAVSTHFGLRGYDAKDGVHLLCGDSSLFAAKIKELLGDPALRSKLSAAAKDYALKNLSWDVLAEQYRQALEPLFNPAPAKRKLLVVTYRYTDPPRGGAEVYLTKLLEEIQREGDFSIDIATVCADEIRNRFHFSANYASDPAQASVPAPLFARALFRFPLNEWNEEAAYAGAAELHELWHRESIRHARMFLKMYRHTLLMGGWHHAEKHGGAFCRWCGEAAEIYCAPETTRIFISGQTLDRTGLRVGFGGWELFHGDLEGAFSLEFEIPATPARILRLETSAKMRSGEDPRRLGLLVTSIREANGSVESDVPLNADYELFLRREVPEEWVASLIELTECRSPEADEMFLKIRGPHSEGLETFLSEYGREYDVALVQGVPFSVSVMATQQLKQAGVRVALLPHYHMEDRYYHWRVFSKAFRAADSVLTAPNISKAWYFDKIGANAFAVAGGGVDPREFKDPDHCRSAFAEVCRTKRPFVLVLGRKDGAKHYAMVVEAVEGLNLRGMTVDLVMIGPDNDGVIIERPHVKYLGVQPRAVVLGALAACDVVVNMSESESFGIVLVEAWMSRRPVVANRDCVAFGELVNDGVDGFLCSTVPELSERIRQILADPALAERMGMAGYKKACKDYTWGQLGKVVNRHLLSLIQPGQESGRRPATKPSGELAHV
jgi:glycosyltransferase involved in cell wall biosynthesis